MPTYSPNDAFSKITPQLGNVTLNTTMQGTLADDAHRYLWNVSPWRWERKTLPNITVVDNTQDYTGANVPSDFMGLLEAEIVRTDSTPNEPWTLDIKKYLYQDTTEKKGVSQIKEIAFMQELNSGAGGFRIRNPEISGSTTAIIRGVYRALPATKYTSANLSTAFGELPDQYFHVYQEVLLWLVYRALGDPRAGTVQVTSGGRVIYTGQLGIMRDMIEVMFNSEDISDTETVFPEESLGPSPHASALSLFP